MHWLVLVLVLMTTSVQAHDWYDPYCCSNQDCKPIPCEEFTPVPNGWLYKGHTFKQDQMKPSLDGGCHACIYNGQPRCIYFPAGT